MFDSISMFWLLLGLGAGVCFGWLSAKLRSHELANEKLGPLQKSLEQFDCKVHRRGSVSGFSRH